MKTGQLHHRWAAIVALVLMYGCATGPFSKNRDENEAVGDTRLAQAQRELEKNPNDKNARIQVFYERYKLINAEFLAAEAAYEAGAVEQARNHLYRVQQLDPGNPRAIATLKKIETAVNHDAQVADARQLLVQGEQDQAYALLREVLVENPNHAEASTLAQGIEVSLSEKSLMPPRLELKEEGTVSLEFRDANLRSIFEVISRSSGINIILDPNVRADLKASIFVRDASVVEVIDFLLLMHQLGKKVMSEDTILIYPSTKAPQYEELILRTFYLNHADAVQTANLIKTMLPIRDVFVDEKLNMISLKAPYEHILHVEKLIFDEDLPDPEVLLDVEILEINRTRLTDIGIAFPDTFTLLSGDDLNNDDDVDGVDGDGDGNPDNASLTVRDLRNISGRRVGISPGLAIRLLRQDGDSNLLANPRIRVKNREKAKIHIGDKIPIPVTTIGAGNNSFIGQSANYLDVGLKLDVEPRVMLNNEVTIRISLEVSNATFFAGSVFPTIGTRNTSTVLMSGDGETQVLAGLISDEERNNVQKVPGLSSIPLIGRLFSKPREDDSRTEIVLLITPHVVRNLQRPNAANAEFHGGRSILNSRLSPTGGPRQVPALPATLPPTSSPEPRAARDIMESQSSRDDESTVPSPGDYDTGPNLVFPPGTVNPLGEPVYGR